MDARKAGGKGRDEPAAGQGTQRERDAKEGGLPGGGLLADIAPDAPALAACQEISRRAAAAGFEWDALDDVWEQVRGEVAEYNAEEPGSAAASLEFGDILFALVNVARWQGIDAQDALRASNAKFQRRWAYMEGKARESGRSVRDLSRGEQEALWAEAKSKETKEQ